MKITITIDLTSASASAQTSPSSTACPQPATYQSSNAAALSGKPHHQSQAPDVPLQFAAGIPQQTSAAASDEARWLDLARLGRTAGLLDLPQWSPQEFDHYRKLVLALLAKEELREIDGSIPPPPHIPAGSSSSPEPNSGDFRFKANLERFFAALRLHP